MRRTGRKKEWSVVLFCGGILVLLPPVLTLFDNADFYFGLPGAYVVLYGLWALAIAAIAYGARRGAERAVETNPDVPLANNEDGL